MVPGCLGLLLLYVVVSLPVSGLLGLIGSFFLAELQ